MIAITDEQPAVGSGAELIKVSVEKSGQTLAGMVVLLVTRRARYGPVAAVAETASCPRSSSQPPAYLTRSSMASCQQQECPNASNLTAAVFHSHLGRSYW